MIKNDKVEIVKFSLFLYYEVQIFKIPITFDNTIKACFSNKKYPVRFKSITYQFCTALAYKKILKVRNSTPTSTNFLSLISYSRLSPNQN